MRPTQRYFGHPDLVQFLQHTGNRIATSDGHDADWWYGMPAGGRFNSGRASQAGAGWMWIVSCGYRRRAGRPNC
ncbi:hypothetical protein ACNKHQ_13865 [Shigella flexneri]